MYDRVVIEGTVNPVNGIKTLRYKDLTLSVNPERVNMIVSVRADTGETMHYGYTDDDRAALPEEMKAELSDCYRFWHVLEGIIDKRYTLYDKLMYLAENCKYTSKLPYTHELHKFCTTCSLSGGNGVHVLCAEVKESRSVLINIESKLNRAQYYVDPSTMDVFEICNNYAINEELLPILDKAIASLTVAKEDCEPLSKILTKYFKGVGVKTGTQMVAEMSRVLALTPECEEIVRKTLLDLMEN